MVGLIALCAVLLPLVFRGPRLAWALGKALPPMQGEIHLGGGRLGVGALFSLALGRPTSLVLQDLRVLDPEGVEVFWAADLRAALAVERAPLRIVIHDLRPGVSRWRLARMRTRGGIGFLAAFVPRGRRPELAPPGRPAPPVERERPVRPEGATRPPGEPRLQFAIASAHLDGTRATFDFPGWGLDLQDIRATGSFWAGLRGDGRPPIGFEVRDIHARGGGGLRIGAGRQAAQVPFDKARLHWIGTPSHAPADLLLLVSGATTGRSRLSGRAQFVSLFASRRALTAAPGLPRPGMEIDADWEEAADALDALVKQRGLRGVAVAGEGAHVEVRVRGPFRQLQGRFEAEKLDLTVAGFRLRDLALDLGLRTSPLRVGLDRLSFKSPGGGGIEAYGVFSGSGNARLRMQVDRLATGALVPPYLRPLVGGTAQGWLAARADIPRQSFVLEGMELTLERDRRGPLPRTIRLFTGAPSGAATTGDVLHGSLEGVRYQRGTLSVRRAAASAFGAQVAASLALHTRGLDRDGKTPHLEFGFDARNLDLRKALPRFPVSGRLSMSARASGPLDDLTAHLRFLPPGRLTVFDQPYGLPPQVDLRVRGDLLVLSPFSLAPPGGGQLTVAGKLVFDREVELDLDLRDHRLDRLPVLARRMVGVAGDVSASLRLRGRPEEPRLSGTLDLDAREVPLTALLPGVPGLDRAGLRLAGGFELAVSRRKPMQIGAEIRDLQLAYGCSGARRPVRAGSCVRFQNSGPMRLRSVGGMRRIELDRTRLRTAGSDFSLAGRLSEGDLDARLEGRFAVGLFEPFYRRWPVSVAGTIGAALHVGGSTRAPRVEGTLRVAEPLVVRHRSGRIELQMVEGELALRGGRLFASGVQLLGHGVRLRLDGEAPGGRADPDSPLRLRLGGEIDTALLARSFPEVVTRASGTVRLDGKLEGSLAAPRLDGQVEIGALSARLRQRDLEITVQPARIEVRENRVTLSGLTVDTRPGGRLVVGPPGAPAQLEILKLVPFVMGQVRLPVAGRGLNVALPWLTLQQGAFDVILQGDADQGPIWLKGRAEVGAGRYWPLRGPRTGGAGGNAAARVQRRLPRSMRPASLPIQLDLQVVGDGQRFVIDPGWLPDLHLDLDVRIGGTAARPRVVWDADPRGLWTRFVMMIYRWVS